jgi:hypothetical protein
VTDWLCFPSQAGRSKVPLLRASAGIASPTRSARERKGQMRRQGAARGNPSSYSRRRKSRSPLQQSCQSGAIERNIPSASGLRWSVWRKDVPAR